KITQAFLIRGGALDEGSEDSDFDDDEVDEADFREEGLTQRVVKAWARTPLITRNFFRASLALTIFGWLVNKNQWPEWAVLRWRPTFTRLQLWRPITTFMFFGPFGLSFLITAHFSWTYMGELERMHYKEPADFLLLLLFGAASLLAINTLLGQSPELMGHSLSCYLMYLWSRKHDGLEVNVMDMFSVRLVCLMPWFFVGQSLLIDGVTPVLDLMGIAAGYLYHMLKLKGMCEAPELLVQVFEQPFVKSDYRR
ncbi:unnamed protein product, partial [Chrysoparadoxa australica]